MPLGHRPSANIQIWLIISLIKAVLAKQPYEKPQNDVLARLQEARRQNRLVERDIADWLYCRYLADKVASNAEFEAEVQDVMRGGLRVQLLENGASMFIPASTLHNNKEEMQVNSDEIAFYIKGERTYKIGDIVSETHRSEEATRSIVGEILQ